MALTRKEVKIKLIDKDKGLFFELQREGYKLGEIYDALEEFVDGVSKGTYQMRDGIAYEGATALKVQE